MQLTKDFWLSEFNCNDGTPVPNELLPNVQELATNLQVIRDYINDTLHVLSGYRTERWNKKVGGKKYSKHLTAEAADLTCKSKTPKELQKIILMLINSHKIRQGGVGLYPGFVHYDPRGFRARWTQVGD